jgi:hypothetical protein
LALILLILAGYSLNWTGFNAQVDAEGHIHPAKTLWDWITILTIPIVLGLGAFWFNRAERETEHAIASDRLQEEALQNYLDRMAELLLAKGLRASGQGSEVRELARARTLTVAQAGSYGRYCSTSLQAELIKTEIGGESRHHQSRGADLTEFNYMGPTQQGRSSGADLTRVEMERAGCMEPI